MLIFNVQSTMTVRKGREWDDGTKVGLKDSSGMKKSKERKKSVNQERKAAAATTN